MVRSIRIQFPGASYHVMARGNRREARFLDDDDRRCFLATLADAFKMTGWCVHGNHYHLFVHTPEANLVAGMQWLLNTYPKRFNVRHRTWGMGSVVNGANLASYAAFGGCLGGAGTRRISALGRVSSE